MDEKLAETALEEFKQEIKENRCFDPTHICKWPCRARFVRVSKREGLTCVCMDVTNGQGDRCHTEDIRLECCCVQTVYKEHRNGGEFAYNLRSNPEESELVISNECFGRNAELLTSHCY